jgi:hypothetical protein
LSPCFKSAASIDVSSERIWVAVDFVLSRDAILDCCNLASLRRFERWGLISRTQHGF